MRMSVSEKAAIFDLLCGTKHVFFVVDDKYRTTGVFFKMHYVELPGRGNIFFSARSLFAGAYSFRQQYNAHTYRARDLSSKMLTKVKAHCLDRWMRFTKNRNPIMHNGRVLLPAHATYEEVLIKLDLHNGMWS